MAYTTIDDPTAYFQTKLYTGNDSSRAITFDGNTDMQPDWSWFKARSEAYNHAAFDSVRGVQKLIRPNQINAEETHSTTLTAFGSNGFSLGGGDAFTNADTVTYSSWHWKAGTSGSGTTTGSGTGKAYSYSVNTDAGFSIVKYIGNGTNGHTIPHHLGAVPQILWEKVTVGNTNNWGFYHHKIGNDKAMYMDQAGTATDDSFLNDTTPSSTVVTLGSNMTNQDGKTFIMYSFAEKQGYSKFGSYTGNSNADGTYVHLGFKPAFLIVKRTDASYRWTMSDNKRIGFNRIIHGLAADSNAAEETGAAYGEFDFTANGFKCRSAEDGMNVGNIVYMAWAESPFVSSSGVPTTAR